MFLGGENSGFSGTVSADNIQFSAPTAGSATTAWTSTGSIGLLSNLATPATIHLGSLGGDGGSFLGSQASTVLTTFSIGALNTDNEFAGKIANIYSFGTGTVAITKVGTGTLALSGGLHSYSGPTTVNNRTLLVANTTGSATGTSAVTVNGVGILGGSGSMSGAVAVNAGGTLAPGQGVGTLTLGASVVLDSGSTYAIDITGSSSHDKIVSSGTVAANGTIKVILGGGYVPAAGATFDVADGTITGTPVFDFTAATLAGGLTWDTTAFATSGVIKVSGGGYDV